MNRAVFVERSALLAGDGLLTDPSAVRLGGAAGEVVRRLRAAGYHVIVATDQPAVARGEVTEEQLNAVHQRMQDLLAEKGTGVDAVYFCPFLAGADAVVTRYRRDSELAKPRPGMFLQAAREFRLDLPRCWVVAQGAIDEQAGRAAGCRVIRLAPSSAEGDGGPSAPDLAGAAEQILSTHAAERGAPFAAGHAGETMSETLLGQIVEELRGQSRERQRRDFSIARLAAAVAQAFALCALGWALYGAIEATPGDAVAANDAIIRLLIALVLQTAALTGFVAAGR
ncbi:MAG: HAD-IIIA family hydrolase [Phycisphaerae bacterium]